jgi:prepilin-type N-terminal cleavage/methylation domain-containing protein
VRRLKARLALLRDEAGYSLTELLTVMAILGVVMSSLTALMVSATNADLRMNNEFQAQTQARMALERFRREGHAACQASPAGPTTSITLTYVTSGSCPATGGTQVSWCTVLISTNRYGLFKQTGATCNATGKKVADFLTVANAFNYATATNRRATVGITLTVNPTPGKPRGTYSLTDDIVLRNSPRPA